MRFERLLHSAVIRCHGHVHAHVLEAAQLGDVAGHQWAPRLHDEPHPPVPQNGKQITHESQTALYRLIRIGDGTHVDTSA